MCLICQNRYNKRGLREAGHWSIAPGFLAQQRIERLTEDRQQGRGTCMKVERISTKLSQTSSHSLRCYFRKLCQVLDDIEILSAVWTVVPL